MIADDEIWQAYALGVKRKRKKPVSSKPPPRHAGLNPASSANDSDPKNFYRADARFWKPDQVRHDERIKNSDSITLDKRVERSMRQGSLAIDAKLDLHGMRQNEAHEALHNFILKQATRGNRNLLIITGKGRAGESVLRTNMPRWLAMPPLTDHILTLRPAAPKHGGEGAWYVVLRRKRD